MPVILSSIALVVSYFSGPMLNYGDFARYGESFKAIKKGNLLGLPVNFIVFSLLVVVTAAATRPVFGELITDPVETVNKIDSVTAALIGALTFMIATVGINIVANFISPAFDFSNVSPQKISWRMGGMIAAIGSILITPWNLYSSPEVIHYTLDTLGCFIGPLYGVLIADYYLVKRQRVVVDDLYSMSPTGRYHYTKGYNPVAIGATALGALVGVVIVFALPMSVANYTWFICAAIGFVAHYVATRVVGNSVSGRRPARRGRSLTVPTPTTAAPGPVRRPGRSRPPRPPGGPDADHRDQPEHHCVDDPPDRRRRPVGGGGAGPRSLRSTPTMGPASIESHYDEALAVPGILAEIRRAEATGAQGYVLACFGDPGLDAARELAVGPVVGIAEAAMHTASFLGRSFSVVTTLSRTAGRAEDLAGHYGFERHCARVRACEVPVLELDDPVGDSFARIAAECRAAVVEDGADVVVLGCAGMADLCRRLADLVGVPVIDGVAAAVKQVEGLVTMGLRTSVRNEFAAPPAKHYTGLLGDFAGQLIDLARTHAGNTR